MFAFKPALGISPPYQSGADQVFRSHQPEVGPRTLLEVLRAIYLERNDSPATRAVCAKAQISFDTSLVANEVLVAVASEIGWNWGDWHSHLAKRFHLHRDSGEDEFQMAYDLLPELLSRKEILLAAIKKGMNVLSASGKAERRFYDLSMLPLNLLLGERAVRYFLPPLDYFQPHSTKKEDPYGLLWAPSRAASAKDLPAAVVSSEDRLLLGAHKFSHTFLMNIDFYCPIGCSDCYKTRFGTREYVGGSDQHTNPSLYVHPVYGKAVPPNFSSINDQAKRVVTWLNSDPRGRSVYDVIVSGGEPLILSNEKLKAFLGELRGAKNLRILRICTGTLFLGLPMRIDDELVEILDHFSSETGVRVTIQAHLACHEQIVAESVIAVSRLRKRGINIYSQVPIKEGINFFVSDLRRTVNELALLGKKQVAIGVEPYMFIVDMHPSTNAFYVPIEPLICVWGALVESHDYPGLERPRTLSILFEGGNIILSGNTMLAMTKAVDKDRGIVTYRIPRVGPDQSNRPSIAEVFEYSEPLGPHNENPDSLGLLRERWLALRY
jgi:L-lysine 2,3-aminomutase